MTDDNKWLISREALYTDIVLNETLCERFAGHMAGYGKEIVRKCDKILTGSSDVGEFNASFLYSQRLAH